MHYALVLPYARRTRSWPARAKSLTLLWNSSSSVRSPPHLERRARYTFLHRARAEPRGRPHKAVSDPYRCLVRFTARYPKEHQQRAESKPLYSGSGKAWRQPAYLTCASPIQSGRMRRWLAVGPRHVAGSVTLTGVLAGREELSSTASGDCVAVVGVAMRQL